MIEEMLLHFHDFMATAVVFFSLSHFTMIIWPFQMARVSFQYSFDFESLFFLAAKENKNVCFASTCWDIFSGIR